MRWNLDLLREEIGKTLEGSAKKSFDELYRSVKNLEELVEALLSVSRIELGAFMLAPEEVDLAAVAEGALGELEPKIKAKSLDIKKDFSRTALHVRIDPRVAKIALSNLISNAVKYTPKGGTVTVRCAAHEGGILCKVADTGYGIPKSDREKVFSKFFRAENIREKEPDGTGLGLYIVKLFVERAGGKIWFESEEGKGSTFLLFFPVGGKE